VLDLDGGVDAGGGDAGCRADADCDDQNACTTDSCQSGACGHGFASAGTQCGSQVADACTAPDTCNANGVCQPNHAELGAPCGSTTDDECANPGQCSGGACLASDEPNGTACTGGSCALAQCVSGQPVGCPVDIANTVPLSVNWSSVGRPDLIDGACDTQGTPDYALVFTAPTTGTYRFVAAGLIDSTPYTGDTDPGSVDGDAVMTFAEASCGIADVLNNDPSCDNDGAPDNANDAQLDLLLTEQQTITVYLNELGQTGGGTVTLSVTLVQ
jgi:hypothetical protein